MGIAWKKSSLIFSAPSLNKHLFSHFVSYLFLLFSQGQFSKWYRTVCGLVPTLTSAVNFPLYAIYVSDTNYSSVSFILVIDFDFFPAMLWSLMWSIWYTWVLPFILFHWFHSWSFLISDIVNEIPTRHIIIKIYFHILYIFTRTSVFVSSSKETIPSVSIDLNVLHRFYMKKSNIKYCPVIRNINKQKLYFMLWTWLTQHVKWVVTDHRNLIWFSLDKWLNVLRQESWGSILVVKSLKLGAEL